MSVGAWIKHVRLFHPVLLEVLTAAMVFAVMWWLPRFPPPLTGWHADPGVVRVFQGGALAGMAAFPAALLMGAALAFGRGHRTVLHVGRCIVAVLWGILCFDTDLYTTLGLHVLEVASAAWSQQGAQIGGDFTHWWVLFVKSVLVAAACLWAAAGFMRLASRGDRVPLLRALARWIGAGAWGTLALAFSLLVFRPAIWIDVRAAVHFFASVPWDMGGRALSASRDTDLPPPWGDLQRALEREYTPAFAHLNSPSPEVRISIPPDRRRDVVLIVVESLRPDMIGPEVMPRVHEWALRNWTNRTGHHATTNRSELGLYALLYGESPLRFDNNLEARHRPTFARVLRAAGYHTLFITGHPRSWYGREHFVNETMWDSYVRTDRGTWADWDRLAIEELKQRLAAPNREPIAAVVLLMASHYDYFAPPQFERFQPTSLRHLIKGTEPSWTPNGVRLAEVPMGTLGPVARDVLWNRYRNSLVFTDDLVGSFVEELDRERTIVALTGDHGEAFGEGGHFGHVQGFGRTPTHTPLIVSGPGVEPGGTAHGVTTHADVLPTILQLLGAPRRDLRALPGRTVLEASNARPRDTFYFSVNRGSGINEVLMDSGDRRLMLIIDRLSPQVVPLRLVGPEGEPLAEDPTPADIDEFVGLFRQLH